MYRDAGKQLLVGRVGEPREIAAAYLHLIESGFSSGQTIVVDGGGLLS
jgi:NAD(P)-dependent dehydrogenase (short-subunit alcohol dehydrogenase family)